MRKRRKRPKSTTFPCPQCGAEVRVGRLSCPECGSDADTGWKDAEEIDYQSIEIPDYLVEDAGPPHRRPRWFLAAAVLALIAFCAWAILAFR